MSNQFYLLNDLSTSRTYAIPPDIPAAKLRPVRPKISAQPPVMYSQPWSPTPSTTVTTPEFLTEKRSAAIPRKNAFPLVAPYKQTFPTITLSSDWNVDDFGG